MIRRRSYATHASRRPAHGWPAHGQPLAAAVAEEGGEHRLAPTAAGFGDDIPYDLARSGERMAVAGTFTGWMSLEDDLSLETNSTTNNLDGFIA